MQHLSPIEFRHIEIEEKQVKRLGEVKADRDDTAVASALDRLRVEAADPAINLMPGVIDAVKAYATVGEICAALADVWGRYIEDPVI